MLSNKVVVYILCGAWIVIRLNELSFFLAKRIFRTADGCCELIFWILEVLVKSVDCGRFVNKLSMAFSAET